MEATARLLLEQISSRSRITKYRVSEAKGKIKQKSIQSNKPPQRLTRPRGWQVRPKREVGSHAESDLLPKQLQKKLVSKEGILKIQTTLPYGVQYSTAKYTNATPRRGQKKDPVHR